jgi:hypothetical protein
MSLNHSISERSSRFEERYNSLSFNSSHSNDLIDRSFNNSKKNIKLKKKAHSIVFSNHENSFVLKKSIEPRNLQVYESYISNPVVLDHLKSNQIPFASKTELVDHEESTTIVRDYYTILLFLSGIIPELKEDFKLLKIHHPMYITEGKNFKNYIYADKLFYIELIKYLLKYDEQIVLTYLVEKHGNNPIFMSKKIINYFVQFHRLDLLLLLLVELYKENKYKFDQKYLCRKMAKIVNILIEEAEINYIKILLLKLEINPNILIGRLIKIAKGNSIRSYIKELKVLFTSKIYKKFIKYKKYEYFLFCKLSNVTEFLFHKDRSSLVI